MQIMLHPDQRCKPLGNLFGLFFEDLNHAADGGLYAELICNRDFEFDPIDNPAYDALTGWKPIGNANVEICTENPPFPENLHFAMVAAQQGSGLCNLGFGDGIFVESGKNYRLSVYAKSDDLAELRCSLCGAQAAVQLSPKWSHYELILTPAHTDCAGRLSITTNKSATFALAYVSLFPMDTWKQRTNGLRRDLVEALADMKPRFLRFPGGCLTHDGQLDSKARDGIYNWKNTVGAPERRPGRRNSWKYHQTCGLGFYEYFLLCEDLGCEPLPVVNAGLDPHHRRYAEDEQLDCYIQDALDLIDFAKGSSDTYWGGVRVQMGHPKPFGMRYLAIGNEEVDLIYHEHMALFTKAIRDKDPDIELIGSSGAFAAGEPFDMGWHFAREQKLSYVDEHYYMSPDWLLANCDRYDDYPADGPKVFLGEYASCANRMENALAEAAYMTSLQNAPAVALMCYAPLMCHAQYVNWQPDMLWYDNHRLCRTVNYHVQRMFMANQGDVNIGMSVMGNGIALCEKEQPIAGRLFVAADETGIALTDVRLITASGTVALPDTRLCGKDTMNIGETDGNFRLELTFRRVAGHKGIRIGFGVQDERNGFGWTIGGWQNADCIVDKRSGGCGSCLTQNNFTVEDGADYRLSLEVMGRIILTTINGRKMNRITDRVAKPVPLYLAASLDLTEGVTILKAVNVGDEDRSAVIHMPCVSYEAETLCASLEAENTLDDPDRVVPCCQRYEGGKLLPHIFPAHSVTVLRFHK